MSPIRLTWARTLGVWRSYYTTAAVVGGFLAVSVISFVFALDRAEGGSDPLASVWVQSIAQWLPVLAAFLGMDVWSDERQSGRIPLLLATPVMEREFTIGKFLGVWTALALTTLFCLVLCLVTLAVHAPVAVRDLSVGPFVAGLLALFLQGGLWCAVAVATSAAFRRAAAAAALTIAALVALPRGLWAALMTWSPDGRLSFGTMPLDAHVLDAVAGSVSSATAVTYVVLTGLALFIASKIVASFRLVGRGAVRQRAGVGFAIFLALLLAGLVITLAARLDISVELPIGNGGFRFSSRTRAWTRIGSASPGIPSGGRARSIPDSSIRVFASWSRATSACASTRPTGRRRGTGATSCAKRANLDSTTWTLSASGGASRCASSRARRTTRRAARSSARQASTTDTRTTSSSSTTRRVTVRRRRS